MSKTHKFLTTFDWAEKKLAENGYETGNLTQIKANFRKFMQLDRMTEFTGTYNVKVDGKTVKQQVLITKLNFFNAFYEPIWKNLGVNERIKSIEWMYETINEKYQLGLKELSVFKYAVDKSISKYSNSSATIQGMFYPDKKEIYLRLNAIEYVDTYPFYIVFILAHELTHAIQFKLGKQMDMSKKHTYSELAQTNMGWFSYVDLINDYNISKTTAYALYKTCQLEKFADLNALKIVKEYIDKNEKCFGVNKKIRDYFEGLKDKILFSTDGYYGYSLNGTVTCEKVVLKGQGETLFKLIMLKNYHSYKLWELNKQHEMLEKQINKIKNEYQTNKISKGEWLKKNEKLQEKITQIKSLISSTEDEIAYAKYAFMETISSWKLPKDFDESKFDVLNMLDEPKSEYCLPEWLREDEKLYDKWIKDRFEEKTVNHTKIKSNFDKTESKDLQNG